MNISLYLINYLQSRVDAGARVIELYIADSIKKKVIEIIIKDDAAKIEEHDDGSEAYLGLTKLSEKLKASIKHLYHRKNTTVHLEWRLYKDSSHSLNDFHSLIGLLALNSPKTRLVFSYISKKGEYVFDSQKVLAEFSPEELLQKEILIYMNELLEEHLNDVRDSL